MNILVTGLSGLLGETLSKFLIKENKIFSLQKSDNKHQRNKNFKIIKCDLANFDEKILPNNIDIIIHLAQSNYYYDFPSKALDIFKINIESTFRLLNFAQKKKVKYFLYTSTGDIYLKKSKFYYDNFYITSKAISEMIISKYQNYFDIAILRLFGLYGKNQKKGLVYNLGTNIKNNKPIFLNGKKNGDLLYLTHVEDCAKCIKFFIDEKVQGTYDVAPKRRISLRSVGKILSDIYKKKLIVIQKPNLQTKVHKPNLKKLKSVYDLDNFKNPNVGLKLI